MLNSYNFLQEENDSQNYYYYSKGFNTKELQKINKGVKKLTLNKATTVAGDNEVRKSKIRWIPQDTEWVWLYEKLAGYIEEANKVLWRFDLYSLPEQIQFTEYHDTNEGHYDWHQDIGPGALSKRKVSITVQLSEPDEYEGGNLELWGGADSITTAFRGKGSVFIFPSYMMHRVTPVTKGVRKSLVLWVGGSHYR